MTTLSHPICSHNLPRFSRPHSYHPAMGRRHRRQPVNPPPPSGLEACETQAQDSCRYLQSSDEIRVPAARRSRRPTRFWSTSGPPFASIQDMFREIVSQKCSEFQFWTHPGPYPRNKMRLMLFGCSEFKFWTHSGECINTLCKLRSPNHQN